MKITRSIALLLTFFGFVAALTGQDIFGHKVAAENNVRQSRGSLIKGVAPASGETVIAYTESAIFATSDRGSTWRQLATPLGLNERIAGVRFVDDSHGFAVLTGHQSVSLAETADGGYTWTRTLVDVRHQDIEDANLDDVRIDASGGVWRLTLKLVSSSNFERQAVYVSGNNGGTWRFEKSSSVKKSESQDGLREIKMARLSASAGLSTDESVVESLVGRDTVWLLTQTGTCFGVKANCLQEMKVRLGDGTDITPPAVKALARTERELAQRSAETSPMFALPPGGTTRISLNRGFDMCNAPTAAQMLTWWNNSPHYDMNIYMSGRNRSCSAQPNLSAAWVDQVTAMGWGLIPTIVGYQSPCINSTTFTGARHSYDTAVAETQGRGESDIAVAAAINLGLTAGSILYYDMERYDETVSTPGCRTATTAFLKGWTERTRELGYKSGTYGSPRNAIDDWQFMPPASKMDAVWMARWDNVMSVWTYLTFPTFPTNEWANHQRIKQWQAPHNETWGGVTFNIDGNISDAPVAGIAIARNKNADFDGDGKSDVSVYRPDAGTWYYINSSNGSAGGVAFGAAGDIPTPGDYDGDGKTDFAVFRPSSGVWHMLTKAGFYSTRAFGTNGDVPAAADFNGDGKADHAVFRPSNGTWYIANSDSRGTFTFVQFGQSGDKPAVGDYDGDGKADIAIFRPNGGTGTEWWILKSSGGVFATQFGSATDKAVPADFTGDGKTDIAFWQPTSGFWFVLRSEDLSYYAFPFGTGGDVPAPGDYDGDNKTDATVFRPSNGVWYLLRSQAGFTAVQFGLSQDRPVPNAYLPQ